MSTNNPILEGKTINLVCSSNADPVGDLTLTVIGQSGETLVNEVRRVSELTVTITLGTQFDEATARCSDQSGRVSSELSIDITGRVDFSVVLFIDIAIFIEMGLIFLCRY